MSNPNIDVIIPVHSASRPISRAVASALRNDRADVRVNVVAHNIDPAVIARNLGDFAADPRVRLLPFRDGIASPAGPMNHGLDQATADYVSMLGSDDELARGALDRWLEIACTTGASTVIARIDRTVSGAEPLPPTRRDRMYDLDPVKDRLTYRCAPLGLVSRAVHGALRFTPGLGSGEDLEFTAALWFTGRNIAYARTTPGYIGHEDADDRVTDTGRSLEQDFAFLDAISHAEWFPSLSRAERKALGVKTLRLHFFDAVLNRLTSAEGLTPHRSALASTARRIENMFPGCTALLSRTDRAVLDAMDDPNLDGEQVYALLQDRWSGALAAKLTRNPFLSLHRQAPYRTLRDMSA
jgi:hypothetical protein